MAFCVNNKSVSLSRYIAFRYVSAGKSSHLVSFMSAISIFGLALGLAILVIVLSVMNGFDRELKQRILGMVPHAVIQGDSLLDDWQQEGHGLARARRAGEAHAVAL